MSQAQDTFENTVAAAQAAHQSAIRAARSAFDAACREAQAKWTARMAAARERFDAGKSEPGQGFDTVRADLAAAEDAAPISEEARHQLARDVAAADEALNQALGEARRWLAAA
jgi:hypothetical protein